jgi:hypothetical protein
VLTVGLLAQSIQGERQVSTLAAKPALSSAKAPQPKAQTLAMEKYVNDMLGYDGDPGWYDYSTASTGDGDKKAPAGTPQKVANLFEKFAAKAQGDNLAVLYKLSNDTTPTFKGDNFLVSLGKNDNGPSGVVALFDAGGHEVARGKANPDTGQISWKTF